MPEKENDKSFQQILEELKVKIKEEYKIGGRELDRLIQTSTKQIINMINSSGWIPPYSYEMVLSNFEIIPINGSMGPLHSELLVIQYAFSVKEENIPDILVGDCQSFYFPRSGYASIDPNTRMHTSCNVNWEYI